MSFIYKGQITVRCVQWYLFRRYQSFHRGFTRIYIRSSFIHNIYMNDIHTATNSFKAVLYADDTNLLSPICSFNSQHSLNHYSLGDVCSNINVELNFILEWLNVNKLSLNASKTKFMLFHYPQRKVDNLSLDLKINSTSIERVSEFNFFSLTLDECLNWKPHVQKISNKISRIIGVLCRFEKLSA